MEHYDLLALAGVAIRRLPGEPRTISALHAVDVWLFRRLPRSGRGAWMVVLELGDPLPAARPVSAR